MLIICYECKITIIAVFKGPPTHWKIPWTIHMTIKYNRAASDSDDIRASEGLTPSCDINPWSNSNNESEFPINPIPI